MNAFNPYHQKLYIFVQYYSKLTIITQIEGNIKMQITDVKSKDSNVDDKWIVNDHFKIKKQYNCRSIRK